MWNACRGDKASKETNSKLEAKKAMQAYQDAYYEGVRHCGHTRLGPRRQRLTRVSESPESTRGRVASAESAVLDAATQREKDAAMQAKANAQAAELLARSVKPGCSRAGKRCHA